MNFYFETLLMIFLFYYLKVVYENMELVFYFLLLISLFALRSETLLLVRNSEVVFRFIFP